MSYNNKYPTTADLRIKAKKRIPKFAYEYLISGCFCDNGVKQNTQDMQQVKLKQDFIRDIVKNPDIKASLCGIEFAMPFGVSPIGLQGMIWPKCPLILAKAAKQYNIPYVLSTLSTNSIEEVAAASDGQALFQLYNPSDNDIRNDLIKRTKDAGYRALFITADIASFGYRPRDIRNGLAIPPNITINNFLQAVTHPEWAIKTLLSGFLPKLKTLTPYMQDTSNSLAQFMDEKMMGGTSPEQLKQIRDIWQGPLILKGILSEQDIEMCIEYGIDGVVVSNHGGRQLDAGQTSISVLPLLAQKYGDKIDISFDSGIESGADIACALASGANFTFSGRSFVYGVSALGEDGAGHTIEMFQRQLKQVMEQIGCDKVSDLSNYLL